MLGSILSSGVSTSIRKLFGTRLGRRVSEDQFWGAVDREEDDEEESRIPRVPGGERCSVIAKR